MNLIAVALSAIQIRRLAPAIRPKHFEIVFAEAKCKQPVIIFPQRTLASFDVSLNVRLCGGENFNVSAMMASKIAYQKWCRPVRNPWEEVLEKSSCWPDDTPRVGARGFVK
jgi:hypothetical protein